MVYYFTSSVVSPQAFIYAGKDKFESEWHHMEYRDASADFIQTKS